MHKLARFPGWLDIAKRHYSCKNVQQVTFATGLNGKGHDALNLKVSGKGEGKFQKLAFIDIQFTAGEKPKSTKKKSD